MRAAVYLALVFGVYLLLVSFIARTIGAPATPTCQEMLKAYADEASADGLRLVSQDSDGVVAGFGFADASSSQSRIVVFVADIPGMADIVDRVVQEDGFKAIGVCSGKTNARVYELRQGTDA